jgi:arsenate reductase
VFKIKKLNKYSIPSRVFSPFGEIKRGLFMIKIYHNNRCSKSRQGIQVLENSGKEFEIVKYLENVPSEKELTDIINLLGITPIQLVRKTEKIWKEEFKGKEMSDAEIIKAMIENPKLIERPIVINNNKAVIGRPSENILSII